MNDSEMNKNFMITTNARLLIVINIDTKEEFEFELDNIISAELKIDLKDDNFSNILRIK